MFGGGEGEDCELFLTEDELAKWYPPPPLIFFLKSEGEKIERKRRKIKMDVGGGEGWGMCTYFMELQFFEK